MIHVQFELNPVCSFEEQGLLVYSYFLVYYFKTMSCGGGILVDLKNVFTHLQISLTTKNDNISFRRL
jgi:hypothetical protein